jgi:RNA polymerase sigma-70 factor (ECF subfamily)
VSARQDEFERVIMCHTRSLLRVARRLTSDSFRAEDLVQECLLLAWRGFHQLREGTNPRAWLFRILFNAFYAQGRKMRTMSEVVPLTAGIRTETPAFDDVIEVSRALDGLHMEHRTVLMLAVVEGFTCNQIAEILAVPLGTVMSRLSRARQAMRTRIAPKSTRLAYAGKENA